MAQRGVARVDGADPADALLAAIADAIAAQRACAARAATEGGAP
jgi:alpha-D-ribose 1-methylphosphonate 5-triphosphate synthase subunit PhnG